ncbi:ATP-binding protein [Amycolatopsis sp. NPDC021455]|uniref:sensor histidine kinase n=1 Tax=Amycolatopsis sp. NPDC021455 TaxID=3154901 RepID=UPI0033C6F3CE
MASRLLKDADTRTECLRQARTIVVDIARSLRGQKVTELGLSREIGTSRAANRIHPSESLRAAMVLFEVITTIGADRLKAAGHAPDALLQLSLATNKLVSQRIRLASSSYMGFLLRSIEQAHLRERKRISREVHDRVGGNVAAAHRQLELSAAFRPAEAGKADDCVGQAESILRNTMGDIRALISDLRAWEPVGGLERALRSYLEDNKPGRMQYCLRVNGEEHNLSPEIHGEAFLIIREAIRNAVKHSGATRLLAQVNITPNELYSFVEDDGVGMDPCGSADGTRNAGLSSMRERASLLEGDVVITSQPGRGTRVELLIPLGHGTEDGA